MAKTKISEFSSTPGNNTDIDSINIAEGCAPSGINDAIRELMAQLKDWQSGTSNDPYVVGSSGSLTLSYGTANGVAYLNGSKVLTTGSALTFDGTNFGIGTSSPSTYGGQLVVANATNAITRLVNTKNGAWTAGDSFGELYFYSSDTSGAGAGDRGYIKSITTDTFGAAAALTFGTAESGGNASEQMRLTSTGLGIGTSSPAYKLDVVGVIRSNSGIKSITASGGQPEFVLDQSGVASWTIYNPPSSTALRFYNGVDRMTLDSSGNLGIGTSSPRTKLDVTGNIYVASGNQIQITGSAGSTGLQLIGNDASESTIGTMSAQALVFRTNSTERARIDSSGRLNVNRTTGGGTVNIKSQTNSFISEFYHYSNDASVGSITTSTTATTYGTSSDYRLKNVIGPVADAGSRIDALEPVEYEWKSDGSRTRGFLAHKFQEVYAGSVTGSKDAVDVEGKPVYQAMQAGSSEVIADLVAEIKSLRQRLAAAGI